MTQTSPQQNPQNPKQKNENQLSPTDKKTKPEGQSDFSSSLNNGNLNKDTLTQNSQKITNLNNIYKWWSSKTIQFKTTVIAILIGVIPVVVVGGITSQVVSHSLKSQIENQEKNQVDAILKEINLLLGDRYKDIQVMANLEDFTNPQNILSRQEKEDKLNKLLEIYKFYDSIAVFDENGNTIAQTEGKPLSNHLNRTYIQEAKKKDGAVISEPLISTTEGTFNIYFASVIKNKITGNTIGFIRTRMPVAKLKEILDSSTDSEHEYYLVNKTGEVFLSNEGEYVNKILTTGEKAQNTNSKYEAIKTSELFPKLGEIVKKEGINTATEYNTQDKKKQFLVYGSTDAESSNVKISAIIANDLDKIFATKNKLNQALFLGIIFTGGIVGTIAVWISKKLTEPILRAAQTIERITEGDLDAYLEVEGEDEIAQLSNDINQMTTQIKALLQEQQLFVVQSGLLKNMTLKMTEAFDLETVFNIAVSEIRKALKTDRVIVYSFDDNWQGTVIAESVDRNYPQSLGAKILDPCFAESYVEKYKSGRVQATPDIYKAGLTDCHLQQLEPFGIKANLVAPIMVEGNLLGLLIAHQCRSAREWESSSIDFFSQTATSMGPALERVMLINNQQLDNRLAQQLKNISFKVAECLTRDKVFEVATSETRNALEADRVIIYKFDEDWKGTVISESVDRQYPKALGATIKDPCFAEKYVDKYKQGRIQATNNIYTAGLTKCHLEQLEPFQVKANLVSPIVIEGDLLGLLIVHQCSEPRKWIQSESDFVAQIATQIGPALERLSLLEKQQKSETEQRQAREKIQQRALELLMQVDPVSQGDLTIRAEVTEDEIGTIADSYNATIENLRKIVTQVKGASLEVTRVTNDQEGFIGSLATESMRQAEDIGQALERIQTLAYSARMVLNNAEQAEEAVKQANRSVEEGEMAMNRTVDGILAIRETVAETAKKVKRLGESTQKISKVVNLISSFADQTNLLALNASIEAAHAGEEGRGFAVVAEEVRSLARQSAEATAEISKVVTEIQEETNEVVKAMEAGTEQVVEGTKMVEETRSSLNQITAASAQINQLVTAIAAAAAEQSQTSEEITETMADVATISNETSVAVTQVSESFHKLQEVARQLQATVSKFKV